MLITITNLTSSNLSTDLGLLAPGANKSQNMTPMQAYKMAADMYTLVTAGKASVTVAAEAGRYDALEVAPVTTAGLSANSVTKAKMLLFVSAEQTGTGSSQNVAHGLGVVPASVFVAPTDLTPATVGSYSCVEGVHDATNVKVTVTASKKFKVIAFG